MVRSLLPDVILESMSLIFWMATLTCNSNKEDIKLIEDMGITPDISYHAKKHSLKTVGLMFIAGIRMQRLSREWAGNRKIHGELVRKVEAMRRQSRRSGGVSKGTVR